MSQTDYTIADQDGASFLVDINNQLAAIVSNNSGATEPTTKYAYQWWADTSSGLLKIRNAANSAWVTIGTLGSENLGLLALAGGTLTGALNEAQGANIASAGTVNLTTATGNYVHITGTTTITAITLAQGAERTVVFDGALTLTNGASLLLPTGANITTAAGDTAVFRGEAAGVVRCVSYVRKDGTALSSSVPAFATQSDYNTGTDTTKVLNSAILRANNFILGASITTTSGTSHNFPSIPSWVKIIVIQFSLVSTNGASNHLIRIGDSGGIENTGYLSNLTGVTSGASGTGASDTTGFLSGVGASAANQFTGNMILIKQSGNTWIESASLAAVNSTFTASGGGVKSLTDTLTQLTLTTVGGVDTFDTGSINILYG